VGEHTEAPTVGDEVRGDVVEDEEASVGHDSAEGGRNR
jgi:hypothetical protein